MVRKLVFRGCFIVLALGVVAFCSALTGYIAHKESWPASVHAYLLGWSEPCCIEQVWDKLEIGRDAGVFEKTDALRKFVYNNSVHADHDFEQELHPYDTGGVIRALLDVNEGKIEPLSLMCSSRSNALTGLLDQIGLKSRQVHVFSEVSSSHTFLEVLNPEDGKWYIQDPDYDLFWVDKSSGDRLGLGEILTTPLASVLPCRAKGDCDWAYGNAIQNYFGAAIYFNFDATPLIVVNEDRFDLDVALPYLSPPVTIVEFAQKTWGEDFGEPVLSVIRGGP